MCIHKHCKVLFRRGFETLPIKYYNPLYYTEHKHRERKRIRIFCNAFLPWHYNYEILISDDTFRCLPLYNYNAVCLSVLLLTDMSVVSSRGSKHLHTCLPDCLPPLGLRDMTTFLFMPGCQTALQRACIRRQHH